MLIIIQVHYVTIIIFRVGEKEWERGIGRGREKGNERAGVICTCVCCGLV